MSGPLHSLLHLPAVEVYLVVALVVFAEDAVFVGFVVPGETAAVLAGVAAHAGHVSLGGALAVVIAAAVVGDSVGYEVGRHLGTRMLAWRPLAHRRRRLDAARDLLARRGGLAVLLGRSIAFLRAVMPALAGLAHMPYRRFLPWNVAGGVLWGTGTVLLGYLAGASWSAVSGRIGGVAAGVVSAVVVGVLATWLVRRHRAQRRASSP